MSLVTFIIPTRNRRHLLPRAVESVKNCGTDANIIVVDDASEDDTEAYCSSLQHIQYIRLKENLGTAAARNTGIQHCQTPFIAFLDDDDWRLPGTLQEQLDLLQQNENCGLVYGKVLYANQQHELTGDSNLHLPSPQGDVVLSLLNKNFIPLSSVVVKKKCFDKLGLFDTSTSMLGLEDWDMWLRISGQYEVLAITVPVAVYRIPVSGSGQWYSDIGRQFLKASRAYKKKWFKLPVVKEKLGKNLRTTKDRIGDWASDVIIYDALNNLTSYWEKWRRMRQVAQCWPSNLFKLKFYKALAKALWKNNRRSVINN